LSSLLEFKKEITGGFHPVSVVVDLAPKKEAVINVQSAAAQKLAFGEYTYTFLYSSLSLSHFTCIPRSHYYGVSRLLAPIIHKNIDNLYLYCKWTIY
jgi:hypothetical protein